MSFFKCELLLDNHVPQLSPRGGTDDLVTKRGREVFSGNLSIALSRQSLQNHVFIVVVVFLINPTCEWGSNGHPTDCWLSTLKYRIWPSVSLGTQHLLRLSASELLNIVSYYINDHKCSSAQKIILACRAPDSVNVS